MIRSMTAFARQQTEVSGTSLTWEMRSVNHRFLETVVRLPEELRFLEMDVRNLVKKKLQRGKVECNLRMSTSKDTSSLVVNHHLADQLINAAEDISQRLSQSAPIDPCQLLLWPGVVQPAETDIKIIGDATKQLLFDTIDELIEVRSSEGNKLSVLISDRCEQVAEIVTQTRKNMPLIIQAHKDKLNTRLAELKQDLDPQRIEQEIVLYTTKVDVDEELDRLDAHTSEISALLHKEQAIGRRLDFLMQEMNREANTLGSKSVSNESTNASVSLKVLIEQMREQIQNIE
jgi:uncharacterized protein (TIGR00255 family)